MALHGGDGGGTRKCDPAAGTAGAPLVGAAAAGRRPHLLAQGQVPAGRLQRSARQSEAGRASPPARWCRACAPARSRSPRGRAYVGGGGARTRWTGLPRGRGRLAARAGHSFVRRHHAGRRPVRPGRHLGAPRRHNRLYRVRPAAQPHRHRAATTPHGQRTDVVPPASSPPFSPVCVRAQVGERAEPLPAPVSVGPANQSPSAGVAAAAARHGRV